jgi:hypothetical protein
MEQRHMKEWFFDRLRGLLGAAAAGAEASATLGGGGGGAALRLTGEVTNVGDSTADILMARGKTKRVYDLAFSVVVEHEAAPPGGGAKCKVHLHFPDVSNDTAGKDRDFKVDFPEAGKPEGSADAVKAALAADGKGAAGALVMAARKAVEDAVAAFLAL